MHGLSCLIRGGIWRRFPRMNGRSVTHNDWREMRAKRASKPIGLAIVGAGRIGLIRGEIAAKHPNVGWIGLAENRADRASSGTSRW